MSKSNVNYQGELLNAVRREGILVTIFLTSGFQLKGTVKAFDNYVILLDTDGKQQMIYKHAISTIAPTKPVKLNYNQCSIDGEDE